MPEVVFAIPGDLASATGGYAYDRQLLTHLPRSGIEISHLPLAGSFPHPTEDDIARTVEAVTAASANSIVLFDGLAFSALPARAIRRIARPIVAIVHHPLSYEAGLSEPRRRELHVSEREALALAAGVVVSSATTASVLAADFGVPAERITVAVPGTARVARARSSGIVPSILSVGAVSPRKGYDILVDALARIAEIGRAHV